MKNTICNTILSIISTKDTKFVESKVHVLEEQIQLNEVEKSIIRDIKDALYMSNVISKEFISEKYSYYVENDENIIPALLSKDAIDSAIIDIRLRQLKTDLSKQMLTLGSKVDTMSPNEIKEKFSELYSNVLIEHKQTMPVNDLSEKAKAYEDLVKNKEGLSLGLKQIEEYAGKATKGTIVSILAFTGSFKSTYSLNVAYDNAMAGHNVLYLALEDTGEKIAHRLVLKHITKTSTHKSQLIESKWVRDGELREEQASYYNDKHNELIKKLDGHLILWDSTKINYQTFTDMSSTLRLADKQFMEKTGKGLDAVFIDQLSLLKYTKGSGKKFSYDGALLNDWVSYFREQALNFLDEARQIVVFLVAQTSRDSFAEASKAKKLGEYDASCSSDAHEIERSSSTMITLYKDSDYTLLVNIPKARNGYQPDKPLQVEVYGNYYHVGNLQFSTQNYTQNDFVKQEITFEDLI
jgi:hypothetical protein